MTNHYVPPEAELIAKRKKGQGLVMTGVWLTGGGLAGLALMMVAHAIGLGGLLGGVSFISGAALSGGLICLAFGFYLVKSTRPGAGA